LIRRRRRCRPSMTLPLQATKVALALLSALLPSSAAILPEHAELLTTAKKELDRFGRISSSTTAELRDAVEEDSENVDLLTAVGYGLLPDDAEEGLKSLQRALKLGKKRKVTGEPSVLYNTVVQTLMQLGRYSAAAEAYGRYGYALDAATHQNLALRLAQAAQTSTEAEAARNHSARALALAPIEPTSHLCLAFSLLIDGPDEANQQEAEAALTKAFELRSDDAVQDSAFPQGWPAELEAHAHHLLGKLIASTPPQPEENGRLSLALEAFQAAVRLAPQHAPYQESLNAVYSAMLKRRQALGEASSVPAAAMVVDKNEL